MNWKEFGLDKLDKYGLFIDPDSGGTRIEITEPVQDLAYLVAAPYVTERFYRPNLLKSRYQAAIHFLGGEQLSAEDIFELMKKQRLEFTHFDIKEMEN